MRPRGHYRITALASAHGRHRMGISARLSLLTRRGSKGGDVAAVRARATPPPPALSQPPPRPPTRAARPALVQIDGLQPRVQPEHAPYGGYLEGEYICDHDVALGYVLEHDGAALPCYASLAPEQQAPVRFTQAKLQFNHGWLVQVHCSIVQYSTV